MCSHCTYHTRGQCTFPGCSSSHYCRGWCKMHWQRWRRHGDPGVVLIESHGMTHTPTWYAWAAMIQRCTNFRCKAWPNYGGRGIIVCERWLHSFTAFLEDMGERPSPELTLDRINNEGNYEPDNCQWATRSVQQRNKRLSTSCRKGHLFTLENTYTWKGVRRCRECMKHHQPLNPASHGVRTRPSR